MNQAVRKPQAVAQLESAIVRLLRARGELSRVELARELKLVPSTAGIYVDRLVRRGFLLETARAARGLGRPPIMLHLNPQGGRFIGVDFDARQVMAVAVDFSQQPLAQLQRTLPARSTTERVLTVIEELIDELRGQRTGDVLGVGLGVPGPIDPLHGVSRRYDFIRGWRDVAIGPHMAARFSLPVFVENNLRSMALAEFWCGEGRGLGHLVCLGIRSGIGSGVIVDGKLLGGAHNQAGEIGRWLCPESWLPAMAQTKKSSATAAPTIEDAASITALLRQAAEQLAQGHKSRLGKRGDVPTAAELLAAAEAGDKLACSLVGRAAEMHGWIVHQLALLLDPDRIVVAGPLAESESYFAGVRAVVSQADGPDMVDRVARSNLGAFAGARGAAALAFHHWKPRRGSER